MYTYPLVKTGTAQDLMTIVARACERRNAATGIVLPEKTAAQRALLEAPFNLLGIGVRLVMHVLPADTVLRFHDWLFRTLAKRESYPFDPQAPAIQEARRLVAELGDPAIVALISHPPVYGDMAHMNFQLVRQAMLALREARQRPCRPRLVVAVDLFALDTISIAEEGVYAGYMGLYHLGLDRLSVNRGWASSLLVSPTAWHRMVHRLIGLLHRGGEVGMVLSGGVPETTRVLYAAREWVQARRRESPLRRDPAQVLQRLRRDAAYRKFESDGPCGPGLHKSAWRMLEAWVMQAAADGDVKPAALAALAALDLPADLKDLEQELARETPYRRRFFRVLAGRVRPRRPVVFIPIAHRDGGVDVKKPWHWTAGTAPLDVDAFAKRFVEENFQ